MCCIAMTFLHIKEWKFFTVGRSNAINIAERLGVPKKVLDKAREQYGAASAEINEVTSNGLPKLVYLSGPKQWSIAF